jgi:hypothetical protein
MAKQHKSGLVSPSGQPLQSTHTDHATDLWNECVVIAQAAAKKPLADWTQTDRFSAAVVAGAHLHYVGGELETVWPINITLVDGRHLVTQAMTPPPVTETKGAGAGAPPNPLKSISESVCSLCKGSGHTIDGKLWKSLSEEQKKDWTCMECGGTGKSSST